MIKVHRLWVSASIVLTIGMTSIVVVGATPIDADTVVAVFPPWWDAASVMQAAASAGSIVDLGRWPATLIVHGDRTSLASRLRAGGALIVLDAGGAGGCRTRRSDLSQ